MIEAQSQSVLKQQVIATILDDRHVLDELRAEIRELRSGVRRIQPRSTTAVSLVATDGGNNSVRFDPFLVQLVRVVDSSNNEYCLEAVSPTTDVAQLSARQFDANGQPRTPLGHMMAYLGVRSLVDLSHMIRPAGGRPVSPSWVQVYRELTEWAVLFSILRSRMFATDTILIVDGFLRSKVFAKDLFGRLIDGINQAITDQRRAHRRRVYLAGVAKHSQVLTRYRLAMALEEVLTTRFPAYVEIPREIEEKAYTWSEYARGADREQEGQEANKFVGGKLFFVKFGDRPRDPIWPVDIFLPQVGEAAAILGYMLQDALEGFPVPHYPRSLQKAHEHAALVDFDYAILQDQIFAGIRQMLGDEAPAVDIFRLQDPDPAQRRYGGS